ncbi:coiled-coil domain-containing protein [Rubrobacter aplysinae]|uniref:hypothetical protein n=1 Tax=Rubrobacter aplysinae TaxID=909625 RepID=UPI00064BE042|nr:hypothetical protein [Rubrobacter aplysinae]
MSSAEDTDPPHPPSGAPEPGEYHEALSREERLVRLIREIEQAAGGLAEGVSGEEATGESQEHSRKPDGPEALRDAARRWSGELDLVRRGSGEPVGSRSPNQNREEHLQRLLAEKDAELRTLRVAAAGRELDLQREHATESRRQQEEIASLKQRLAEAEETSSAARDEELREVKRLAYERESELRRASAEKLSEAKRDAERRISALRAQREADNRSLTQTHATERARKQEELESLRLRRLSETRVYGSRLEELARDSAGVRTSLEEAVAKLREKHEAERARLAERVEVLEEELEEQEAITVGLLAELGYLRGGHRHPELPGSPGSAGELEKKEERPRDENQYRTHKVQEVLRELREMGEVRSPGDLLGEGLTLFNESEHVNVIRAICKSLGEPEVYATLEDRSGTTIITLLWAGMNWRRYVSEPRAADGPKVYLAGYGEGDHQPPLPEPGPNARLDAQGLLALGVRPL